MDKEIELKLVEKYPKILRDYGKSPMESCLAFGFEFSNGWEKLIEECLEKLQYFIDLCSKDGREFDVILNQAKEKFGSLRFYVSTYGVNDIENDIIDDIISEAERKSTQTCEETGEYGTICKRGGWLKTLCRTQARELGYVACNEETEKYWQQKDAEESKS